MPLYTVHLKRQHKTDMWHLNNRNEPFEVARAEVRSVDVAYDLPVTTVEAYAEFKQAVLSTVGVHADDSAWQDWEVCQALEGGRCPAPPASLFTPKDSLAERHMRQHAQKHVSLYGDDAYTPYDVFEQWFFTCGNGMEWTAAGTLRDANSFRPEKERDLDEDRSWFELGAAQRYDAPHPVTTDRVRPYPLSESYSRVFTMPDNVEDSYLLAALDLCTYFLTRPTRWSQAYDLPMLLHNKPRLNYDVDDWRTPMMQDALHNYALIEKAYQQLWDRFGERLTQLAVSRLDYIPDDTPPGAFISGDDVWAERALTPEERARRDAFMHELLSELRSSDPTP